MARSDDTRPKAATELLGHTQQWHVTLTWDDLIEAVDLAARRVPTREGRQNRAYRALSSYRTVDPSFKGKATVATMSSSVAKSLGVCGQEVPICIGDAVP